MRQWTYQYCSQLAYFQTPGKDSPPLRSANTTIDDWVTYCHRVFKADIDPNTWHWNMRYGAKKPAITNVIYTNGDEDPWKWASVLEADNLKGEGVHPIEIICDDCAHCVDLHNAQESDSENLTNARAKITEIIQGWLAAENKAIA